jgi:hypothetical protein
MMKAMEKRMKRSRVFTKLQRFSPEPTNSL